MSGNQLELLLEILNNADDNIVNVQKDLKQLFEKSDEHEAFNEFMVISRDYEKLISIRLDELQRYFDTTNNFNSQCEIITDIRYRLLKKVSDYNSIVQTNNNLAIQVQDVYDHVEERIIDVSTISDYIGQVISTINFELALQNRTCGHINLLKIKTPQLVHLINDKIVINISDYVIEKNTEYIYKVLTNQYQNTILLGDQLTIFRTGAMSRYKIIVYVELYELVNHLIIPVSENVTVMKLKDGKYTLDISDYFEGNNTYTVLSNPFNNAIIIDGVLHVHGSYSNNEYTIEVIINDDDIPFVIYVQEYITSPTVTKVLNDGNILNIDKDGFIIYLPDYFAHTTSTLVFSLDKTYPNIRIIDTQLEIQFSNQYDEYEIIVRATTLDAIVLNNYIESKLTIVNILSPPVLTNAFYTNLDVVQKRISYYLKQESVFVNLSNCFKGDNIAYSVDYGTHPNTTYYDNTTILKIQGNFRGNTYNLIAMATNNAGSETLTVTVQEEAQPDAPITLKNFLPESTFFILSDTSSTLVKLSDYFNVTANISYYVEGELFDITNGILELKGSLKDGTYNVKIIASNNVQNPNRELVLTIFEYAKVPRILYEYMDAEPPELVVYKSDSIDISMYFNGTDIDFVVVDPETLNFTTNISSGILYVAIIEPKNITQNINILSNNSDGNGDIITIIVNQIDVILQYDDWGTSNNHVFPISFDPHLSTSIDYSTAYIDIDTFGQTGIINSLAEGWTFEIIFSTRNTIIDCVICSLPFDNIQFRVSDNNLLMEPSNRVIENNISPNAWYHVVVMQNGTIIINGVNYNFFSSSEVTSINGSFTIGTGFYGMIKIIRLTPSNNADYTPYVYTNPNLNASVMFELGDLNDAQMSSVHEFKLDLYFRDAISYEVSSIQATSDVTELIRNNATIVKKQDGYVYLILTIVHNTSSYNITIRPLDSSVSSTLYLDFIPTLLVPYGTRYNVSIGFNVFELDLSLIFQNVDTYTIVFEPIDRFTDVEQLQKAVVDNNILTIKGNGLGTSYIIYIEGVNEIGKTSRVEFDIEEVGKIYIPSALSNVFDSFFEHGMEFTWNVQNSAVEFNKSLSMFDYSLSSFFIFSPFTATDGRYSGTRKTSNISSLHSMLQCFTKPFICTGYSYVVNLNLGPKDITVMASDGSTFTQLKIFTNLQNRSQELEWINTKTYDSYYILFTSAYNQSIQLADNRFIVIL